MTLTCAAVAVFWISYPRFQPFYAMTIAAVAISLIGANFHFLSDVMAGAFIGCCTGWIAVLMWDAGDLPRLAPMSDPKSM